VFNVIISGLSYVLHIKFVGKACPSELGLIGVDFCSYEEFSVQCDSGKYDIDECFKCWQRAVCNLYEGASLDRRVEVKKVLAGNQ